MACEHSENDDIAKEKSKLASPTARPPTRVAGTPIVLHVDGTEQHEQVKLDALSQALGVVHAKTGQGSMGSRCTWVRPAGASPTSARAAGAAVIRFSWEIRC